MARTVESPWFRMGDKLRRNGSSPRDPYTPPSAPVNSTPWLPFDLNVYLADMRASAYKAYLHGFLTFPLGGDGWPFPNSPTWDLDRLPTGTVKLANGDSLLRDVLYDPYRSQRPIPSQGGVPPEVIGRVWDCQQASRAGWDGEFPDVLNLSIDAEGNRDDRWGQLLDLVWAANLATNGGDPYDILPMLDGNTSVSRLTNRAQLITRLGNLWSDPRIYKEGGAAQIGVYMPEAGGPASKTGTVAEVVDQWAGLQSGMASIGKPIEFTMCPQRGNQDSATPSVPGWAGTTLVGQQGYGAALAPFAKRMSRWGSRNPVETLNTNAQNAGAAAYSRNVLGRPWMAPVSVRDSRPNQSKYEECRGWDQLRASFKVATDNGAVWIQAPTRSDMAEHAHMAPSRNHGWTSYDISSYYLVQYKLRVWPTILTDTVYITHRVHRTSGVTITTSGLTMPTKQGSTGAADIVEAFVFLTDPTDVTVEITSGGVTRTFIPEDRYRVYGGEGVYAFTVDLNPGPAPSARILRDGRLIASVVSQFPVVTSTIAPDMDYRSASSGRQVQGAPA